MATTLGTEQIVRPTVPAAFDCPPGRRAASVSMAGFDSPSVLQHRSPRSELPPPNPHFVFPARPPSPSSLAPSDVVPRTNIPSSGRRPMSAIESPTGSFGLFAENADRPGRAALPDFNFNPGASINSDSRNSFLAPSSPEGGKGLPSPSRPTGHGHRRGGSEFVGGRLREGNSIAIMSTSPTKSENGLLSATLQPPRRGHRRGVSSTISTNNLPILQPPVFDGFARGSSAPNSPTNFPQRDEPSISMQLDVPAPEPEVLPIPEPKTETPKSEDFADSDDSKESKSNNKARVGFSDTLEFIPRPLSLVSNETSSTVTARLGHSVSGSISSIVSGASPSGRGSPVPLSRSPTRDTTDSRPSTAGAILERTQDVAAFNSSPKRRNSIPTLLNMADAAHVEQPEPSPTKTSKRWSFFARESPSLSSPTKPRPQSSGSSGSGPKASPSLVHGPELMPEAPVVSIPKKKKKSKKKKKKVKGWAGAILPMKPKGHTKAEQNDIASLPTPPATAVADDGHDNALMMDPELLEPSMPTVTVTESPDLADDKPRWRGSEEESSYQMIDLDAALGPFNTPIPINPEWEAAQRAAGNVGKRRLHSAQGMKGFSGPGMHYHRRAESAPDLPPFDPGRAGIHRFNSSSTMADVFEEDEEDDDDDSTGKASSDSDSDSDATPPALSPKDPMLDAPDRLSINSPAQSVRRINSNISEKEQSATNSVRAERSRSSLHDSVILEESSNIIFRSPNMNVSESPDASQPCVRRFSSNKELAPVDTTPLQVQAATSMTPISPYAISHASSFPSPRSPMSMDAQRISTAPSSITDENNFQSLLLGEPGPEVRISVDYDIPSLTPSNSTMSRDCMFVPTARMSQPTLREPRPVSVSSAAFGRRRSSLASLSRLISSSHGERSKLSMEVTLDNEPTAKKSKTSRTKRLSRMMQFWKGNKEDSSQ